MLVKLTFSYDGSKFQGSASQPHKNTVQDKLAQVLGHLGIYEKILFASRTDKGVHATNAVASVEIDEYFRDFVYLKNKINYFAHPYIHVKNIQQIPQTFQVRFDVKKRKYYYVLFHGNYNPFLASYVHFYPKIDLNLASKIISIFEGEHDFKFFQKEGSNNKTTIRKIYKSKVFSYKDYSIFSFEANGFLRSQIRMMMAGIFKVLETKISQDNLKEQIDTKKIHTRLLAPSSGLYLSKIIY
ncbi:tRNA pseudouridine(38-40) synthase TruA [Campylobacter insulaenigrae]|uniref:tRNA pseudouridine synthase A n=1 Tax=Campylobacter insulaenigrae NCTC 12927 TaxID=1031564 RepID=A0A0A8H2L4_9BACT|nr:tRNA pseudouridine(38-40) synthase TruA [Campylobacter insulaenigrae]AJC87905.1 tRNA pseudouridine synthase I [Campylobacter insulaenigrae NCTC 12927]MCR6590857.1 tRNA pseudouridine(38-40) synthase TruA [Campylobacter insulaenigrae]MCR6592534.1 tRNA pseudouridine(38-40) synthase TruA [Campylobacter insulaenigrae]MCR6593683.1 tRNA pseudouridine(38-40) synthase TruA [Campylobacter insulaenigrae]VEH94361.1 tRNA pseudouridine synthase A [Campylobacter insulaenigrae]